MLRSHHTLRYHAAAATLVMGAACASGHSATNSAGSADSPAPIRSATWVDSAGRRNGRVTVDGTTIHYVDYGGSGPPVVFLAGLGNSAHVFDEFAPRFTDAHHVAALTRRGYGESGRPADGYDTGRLTDDVRAALDSLGLERVVVVGHSLGGDELTDFAVRYPARVAGLVYLDAAYDRSAMIQSLLVRSVANQMPPAPPKPTGKDRASVGAYRDYLARTIYGVPWPESEVRATRVFDTQGKYVRDASGPSTNLKILRGERPMAYARIGAPVLAIYAVDRSVDRDFPWVRRMTIGRGAAETQARRAMYAERDWESGERRRLAKALPQARIVEVRDASHFLFISHPELVERELRAFLALAFHP